MQAFGNPQPLFQIGLDNDSLTDLRPESEAGPTYTPGDPWNTMRRALNAAYSDVTLRIPLTNDQANLNYAVHVKTLTDSGATAGLALIVNHTTNATQTASNGGDLFWYIPSLQLTTGTNSLMFRYEGGTSASVGFDWLDVGGAGRWDTRTTNNAEFIYESGAGDHFYVTDPNWLHWNARYLCRHKHRHPFSFCLKNWPKIFLYVHPRIIGPRPGSMTFPFRSASTASSPSVFGSVERRLRQCSLRRTVNHGGRKHDQRHV
jgi:hypothetical protein